MILCTDKNVVIKDNLIVTTNNTAIYISKNDKSGYKLDVCNNNIYLINGSFIKRILTKFSLIIQIIKLK
jgi:hypothetical protein